MDIGAWLQGLGLERYEQAFRDNDIDGEILRDLTPEDLVGLGVASIGHRRKLLAAIARLREPAAAPRAEPADGARTVERRLLTIMFCDIVGSTELATRLDPEDLREVIAAYHSAATEVLSRLSGFIAKYMGDGILAYFGYPRAHEADAEQAVRAGLAIVDAVARLGLAQPIAVRLGIATGLVVVGDLIGTGAGQEESVVGETPNLAARLQGLAEPNGVVIADATRRQIGELFELRDLGAQELKGFAGPTRAWQVIGESDVASRFEALRSRATPLVGREEELDLLLRRWEQAKTGEGRVVLLSAEPGIGKSRLTEALYECIVAEPHHRVRYFCSPHHEDSAFYPIAGQLERAAGFTRGDNAATRRGKLARLFGDGTAADDLALVGELLAITAPDVASLAALTPQQRKERTFEALLRGLERLAAQHPVLLVFEDVHWIDPTSRELLDRTIARVERLPVLLIATFRPEFQPPWIGQPHLTMLALSRLGRRDGAVLVQRLAANAGALPADIVDEIIERTDGVPLFLEEVTKVVLEAEAAAARGAVAAVPRARAAVPATLQASLMARLDRLGPAAREVAQTGAAIGRDFSYELALAVGPRGENATREALDQLVAAGLVFQRGMPPAAEYQFKHALVQDTAYDTLLRGPRQALHGRIATALRRLTPEVTERAPETLAHHLAAAGELDAAASYWLAAGRRSAARSTNVEAAAQLARAIAALRGLDETAERNRVELDAQLALGPALLNNRGFSSGEAGAAYRRAGELADRLDDDRARFAASWGLWITTGHTPAQRQRHLADLVVIAERIADPELTLQAHHSAWATWIWLGEFTRTAEHVRRGLELYDPDKHRHHALLYGGHDPGVCGKSQHGMVLWALGYPDQALQSALDSVALSEKLDHFPSALHALWFVATAHFMRRDVAATAQCAERLLSLAREHGMGLYEAHGGTFHAWALCHLAGGDEALTQLRAFHQQWKATSPVMLDLGSASLAEAELHAGRFDRASTALDEAAALDLGWWAAEIARLRGDLALAGLRTDGKDAEYWYRRAIEVAQRQEAKSFELRAAIALARLWANQGRRAEAQKLLAPIYSWFREGLETRDLRDAKALLDELF